MAEAPLIFGKVWGFLQRDFLTEWRSRFSVLLHLLNIGLTVAAYVFMARLVAPDTLGRLTPTKEGYFSFVLVGMATNGAMITAFTGLSRSLQFQQPAGVLKSLLMSQTRPEAVLLLSSLYPLVRALVDFGVYFLVGWVLGGFSLARANVPGAARGSRDRLSRHCRLWQPRPVRCRIHRTLQIWQPADVGDQQLFLAAEWSALSSCAPSASAALGSWTLSSDPRPTGDACSAPG